MTHLSDVFKYISHFRHAGHQIGRKVGDMLEVLTYAALANNNDLLARLLIEPKLFGFTGAGHKVEFTILKEPNYNTDGSPKIRKGGEIDDPSEIIGFIECKKVGVEQTVNGKFKNSFVRHNNKSYKIPYQCPFTISFAPRDFEESHSFSFVFNQNKTIVITKAQDNSFRFEETIKDNHRIIFALSTSNQPTIFGNNSSLRDFPQTLKNCKILEVISIDESGVIALLNDCLSGPQTPEKAKQSSFVALDVRKKRFNSFDRRLLETEMVSALVLTEVSHWEEKSLKMITSCIDKNMVVDDSIIVESFELFENHFGSDFYDLITKESFENNNEIRSLTMKLLASKENKIFRDIEDNVLKKISLNNNSLIFIS